jgi:hypothetical protein
MIKGLMGSANVIVSGGNTSVPYVNQNAANPIQGMLRVYGNDMQVFDGNNWITMSTSYATVDLSPDTQSILQWARSERDRQFKRQQLVENNPALQKALEAIERANANFDILAKFVENDNATVQTSQ